MRILRMVSKTYKKVREQECGTSNYLDESYSPRRRYKIIEDIYQECRLLRGPIKVKLKKSSDILSDKESNSEHFIIMVITILVVFIIFIFSVREHLTRSANRWRRKVESNAQVPWRDEEAELDFVTDLDLKGFLERNIKIRRILSEYATFLDDHEKENERVYPYQSEVELDEKYDDISEVEIRPVDYESNSDSSISS
ncbi:hypothetical protein ACOME3_003317 [Neoechinorhynchus agilis]